MSRRISNPVQNVRPKTRMRTSRPEFGDPAEHERSAVAFWFRRLASAIAIGNGAGLVALNGYVGSAQDQGTAAVVAYPAATYFLIGLGFAVASFLLNLIWVSLRIQPFLDYVERLQKLKFTLDTTQTVMANLMALVAGIVILANFGCFLLGGGAFFAGAGQMTGALRAAACTHQSDSWFCAKDADWFTQSSDMDTGLYEQSEPTSPSDTPREQLNAKVIFGDFRDDRSEHTRIPTEIDLIVPAKLSYSIEASAEQIARVLIDGERKQHECDFSINDFYIGKRGPLFRNPDVDKFLRLNGSSIRGYKIYITLKSAYITFKSLEESTDRRTIRIDLPNRDISTEVPWLAALQTPGQTAFTFSSAQGGLLTAFPGDPPLSDDCELVVAVLGMRRVGA